MTHILAARPVAHRRFSDFEPATAGANSPRRPAKLAPLSYAATIAAIVLVAFDRHRQLNEAWTLMWDARP